MNTGKTTDRRGFLKTAAMLGTALVAADCVQGADSGTSKLPMPQWSKLPRWRGFNLLEKFVRRGKGRSPAFLEDDFRWIHELGFNFVRLPMDYRTWIVDGDWRKFDEQTLAEIDQAVQYGIKYDIHVKINFHRVPGYTVAKPSEAKPVWTDPEALEVCALHWNTFAKRYRGISNRNLSFNLFNEPGSVEIDDFMKVHRTLCEAVRAEDPERLIICDGLSWGTKPTMELLDLHVAQATRGYMPMEISHYRASWVGDWLKNMKTPPSWPLFKANGMLFSPTKKQVPDGMRCPIRFELGPEVGKTKCVLRVGIVSSALHMTAVGLDENGREIATFMDKEFKSGPGDGEWSQVVYKKEWNCYQNYFGRDYEFEIPSNVRVVELRAGRGDWMAFERVSLQGEKAHGKTEVKLSPSWTESILHLGYQVDASGNGKFSGTSAYDRKWHYDKYIVPWKEWEAAGGGLMVGEFGAYRYTPHEVVLAWMEDLLSNWRDAGWGWAMWNFRGSIGVLDSGREDVAYEDFHGHKMDRKMMDLLMKY